MWGYGRMGEVIRETELARLYEYHGWELWIAKSLIEEQGGEHYAPTFAIRSAKEHAEGVEVVAKQTKHLGF